MCVFAHMCVCALGSATHANQPCVTLRQQIVRGRVWCGFCVCVLYDGVCAAATLRTCNDKSCREFDFYGQCFLSGCCSTIDDALCWSVSNFTLNVKYARIFGAAINFYTPLFGPKLSGMFECNYVLGGERARMRVQTFHGRIRLVLMVQAKIPLHWFSLRQRTGIVTVINGFLKDTF